MIDLTHIIENDISIYPGTEAPEIGPASDFERDGYRELSLGLRTHTGTHIDAPAHIIPDGKKLDNYPIDWFIGGGVVIDCRGHKSIDVSLLAACKEEIESNEFILFYTGWDEKWKRPAYFDPFPVLTEEAARWLTEKYIKAVGFDSISADEMGSITLPIHHILLGNEVLIIENLCNMAQLLGEAFELNCIPLSIKDTDGSPVRVFARLI